MNRARGGLPGRPRSGSRGSTAAFLLPLAAATSLALACLPASRLYSDARWVGPTMFTIALVCAVGGLLRALPVPVAAIPFVQSAAFVLAMAYHLRPTDTGGAGARLAAFRDLVRDGVIAVRGLTTPVPGTPETVALVVVAVFVAAVLVETLTVGFGLAGASGAVLLVMAAVPVRLTAQDLRLLAGPAAGWLLLMAADQWARQQARGAADPKVPRAGGSSVGLVAITAASLVCSGLVIAVLAPAPAVLPWLLSMSPSGGSSEDLFVNIRAELQGGNRQQEVLSYRSSDGGATYLGMVTLERFDGQSWTPWARTPGADSASALTAAVAPGPTYAIQVRELGNPYLPVPDQARIVTVAGAFGVWSWDRNTSDVVSTNTAASGLAYHVQTSDDTPGALAAAGQDVSDADRRLPVEQQAAVEQTALEVTAGSTSNYDRALKLQEWFSRTGGFVYSLTVPDPGTRDPVVAFLNDRQGFCQQYSTAMAVLARSLQIPARVVVGFAGGSRREDGSFFVTRGDAHAWPELWFPDVGWVRFEPTPATANPSVGPPPPAQSTSGASPTPTPLPSAAPTSAGEPAQPGQPTGGGGSDILALMVAAGVSGVLVLLALAAPGAVRRRSRARRLADLAAGDAGAAWAEIRDTAVDAGIAWATGATTRQQAAGLLGAIDPPPPGDWPALQSVVAAVEEFLYAPAMNRSVVPEYRSASATILDEPWMRPGSDDLAGDVRDVLQRLDGILRPLPGRIFPRSLRRRAVRR